MINFMLIGWLMILALMLLGGCNTTYDYETIDEPRYSVWIHHGERTNGSITIRSQ